MHQFHAKLCCSMVVSVDFTTRVIYYIIISRLGISITEGHQLQYLAALVHQPKVGNRNISGIIFHIAL